MNSLILVLLIMCILFLFLFSLCQVWELRGWGEWGEQAEPESVHRQHVREAHLLPVMGIWSGAIAVQLQPNLAPSLISYQSTPEHSDHPQCIARWKIIMAERHIEYLRWLHWPPWLNLAPSLINYQTGHSDHPQCIARCKIRNLPFHDIELFMSFL